MIHVMLKLIGLHEHSLLTRGGSMIHCRRGGNRPEERGGAPTYDFVKFSQKTA